MISSQKFLDTLALIRVNQANYQKLVICPLISFHNMEADIDVLASKLFINQWNSKGIKQTEAYFRSTSCPVWNVLTGKKLIVKTSEGYKINTKLSKSQKDEAMKICRGLK